MTHPKTAPVETPPNLDSLLHQAGVILQETTGSSVALSAPVVIKNWRRSLIVRCRVESARSGLSSIIIKQIKEDPVRGFSDWASLAFLSGLPEAQGIVPRFYGGDLPDRFFLMEDLGEGQTLQDMLTGSDPALVRTALRDMAVQMARLHSATLGKQESFDAIRAALPETDGLGREWEAARWFDNRGKILDWFKALDCAPPPDFEKCLKHISDIYCDPGDFLAFTHGDPAPPNNHFAKGHVRLLDFEYGGFRHALYDITGWNILCPLPLDCVQEMSRCFREELARTCPAARDEARFAQAWAHVCAYRALAMLTWIPPDVLNRNRPWADDWGMREAVFVAMSRLQQVAAPFTELEAATRAAALLKKSLLKHWPTFDNPESLLPQWPAFKNH